jgi:hypothetical protein
VFPNNVSINYSGGNIQFPRIIADSGKAFSVQAQGTSGSAALSWTVNPDAAGQYAAVGVSKGGGDNLAKVILQAQSDSGDAETAKIWKFDETGTTTLPGALVNSTVAKAGVPDLYANDMSLEVTAVDGGGVVTEVTITNTPNAAWQSNGAGTGVTLGDLSFIVQVDGSGNATVSGITSSGGHTIGEPFTIGGDSFGAEILPTAIDLTKSINKLADGIYSLADGVEGQIMYLVRQDGSTAANISVGVANARWDGGLFPDQLVVPFQIPFTDMVTIIFTDGAWQSSTFGSLT